MSVSNDDSKLVEIIKKIESNCFDFYKLYESGLLFILGIILTGSTASFIEIFRDNKIPLKTVFYNPSFYVLFFMLLIYPFITIKYLRKKKKEDNRIQKLEHDNISFKKTNEEQSIEIQSSNANLNEAQEAITTIKDRHLYEAQEVTSSFLGHLFAQLNFTPYERISLYMLIKIDREPLNNKKDSEFTKKKSSKDFLHIFGRYSSNIEFKEISRPRFSKSEGVLGRTFSNPDSVENPTYLSENLEEYLKESKEYGINIGDAREFCMKSRSFYTYLISENYDRVGVLLCESMTVRKNFETDKINEVFAKHEDLIVQLLNYNRKILKETNVDGGKL